MAKRKQKESLTLEEKLEAALVPEDEQPYEVPGNWCWIKLEAISQIKTGKKDANYGSDNGQYYFFTCASEPIRCDNYSFEGKSILLAGNGDIGNISIYDGKFEAYQRTYVLSVIEPLLYQYVYYFLKYRWVDYNIDKMFGTAIPYIRLGNLQQFPVPISPLSEQKRIVERIERLFSQLDEARDKAQEALEESESRITSILHQAFTGALTVKQRREKGLSTSSWKEVSLKEIVQGFKYGTSEKSDYNYSGMPVLRIPNIGEDGIVFSDMKYLSDNNVDEENQIHENDILIIRSNGSRDLVGKCALIPKLDKKYAYASFLIRIKPTNKVRSDYLVLFLNSVDARTQMFAKAKSSAGIHNINTKELGVITLKLPQLWEQEVIVNLVGHLLLEEKQVKEAAEQVIEQIASTKKAILSKAFRGELGTNDPEDESAIDLLKRHLS